jgi:hypothetical protein
MQGAILLLLGMLARIPDTFPDRPVIAPLEPLQFADNVLLQ